MTAQSPTFETAGPPAPEPQLRWRAVAGIVRNDMALLGPYALAGAIWMLAASALFHTPQDFRALVAGAGLSELGLDLYLFAVLGIAPAAGLAVLVILLVQTNVASDTRHDWLIRPVTPFELVASKLGALFGVIIAPAIAGSFVYTMVNAAPLEEALALVPTILAGCVIVLVLSWLVSTPFRAVLALIGMFILLTVAVALSEAIKIAIGTAPAGAGEQLDPTPFPGLDGSWIVGLAEAIGLVAVSGLTLWLLLARRKRAAARWLFVGYVAASAFLQNLLFDPIDDTRAAPSAPEAALARPG